MESTSNSETIAEQSKVSTTTVQMPEEPKQQDNVGLREPMISSAVRFLQNPKVSSSPMNHKRQFLLSKGLTNQEIDEACLRAGVPTIDNGRSNPQPYERNQIQPVQTQTVVVHRGVAWVQNFRDVLHFVVLLGGAAYGLYHLWRRYLARWLFGHDNKSTAQLNFESSERIQQSILALIKSVEALQVSLDSNFSTLHRLVQGQTSKEVDWERQCDDIRTEIRSVKGIMLGTSRFPTNPSIKPMSIPSWQLEDKTSHNSNGIEVEDKTIEVVGSSPDLVAQKIEEKDDS